MHLLIVLLAYKKRNVQGDEKINMRNWKWTGQMPLPLVPILLSIWLVGSCQRKLYMAATARQRHATTEGRQASQQIDSQSQSTEERQAFSRKIENPHVYKNGPKLSVWQVMVGEKRRDFPRNNSDWLLLGGDVRSASPPPTPALSPSLLWLAAGVVLSSPSREAGGGWRAEHSWGAESAERDAPPRMATDPEIAGVWYKNTPRKALL